MSRISSPNMEASGQCPVCTGLGEVIGISHSVEVFKCRNCSSFFVRDSIRLDSVVNNNGYADFRDCPQSHINTFINDMKPSYIKQLLILEKLVDGRSILDFGCGIGIFLAIAKERCWNIYGIDLSEHAVYLAKKFLDIEYSLSLEEFKSSSLDVVRVAHVLEHIPQPRETLIQLRRVIKPNGILFVITPNCVSLCPMVINKLRHLICKKPKFTGSIHPGGHIIGFNVTSLSKLVTSLGFKQLDIFTVSMGNRTYYPFFYDGLLTKKSIFSVTINSLFRYWLPLFIDNFGNSINRGNVIVGYFRKA